jgi:hypothetical protein
MLLEMNETGIIAKIKKMRMFSKKPITTLLRSSAKFGNGTA